MRHALRVEHTSRTMEVADACDPASPRTRARCPHHQKRAGPRLSRARFRASEAHSRRRGIAAKVLYRPERDTRRLADTRAFSRERSLSRIVSSAGGARVASPRGGSRARRVATTALFQRSDVERPLGRRTDDLSPPQATDARSRSSRVVERRTKRRTKPNPKNIFRLFFIVLRCARTRAAQRRAVSARASSRASARAARAAPSA